METETRMCQCQPNTHSCWRSHAEFIKLFIQSLYKTLILSRVLIHWIIGMRGPSRHKMKDIEGVFAIILKRLYNGVNVDRHSSMSTPVV